MTARALVLAKAPVPGRVKTRLGATVGAHCAAELAAAALLDTIEACSTAFAECHLALDGDLADGVASQELVAATAGWHVFAQSSGDLGDRLARAHEQVARSGSLPVVQVGMDTPQLTPALLEEVAGAVATGTAVLGPALDGGWWVLGLADGLGAAALVGVPMSRPTTYVHTRAALHGAGLEVHASTTLRDVDTAADAQAVAAAAPRTRFAAAWRAAQGAA